MKAYHVDKRRIIEFNEKTGVKKVVNPEIFFAEMVSSTTQFTDVKERTIVIIDGTLPRHLIDITKSEHIVEMDEIIDKQCYNPFETIRDIHGMLIDHIKCRVFIDLIDELDDIDCPDKIPSITTMYQQSRWDEMVDAFCKEHCIGTIGVFPLDKLQALTKDL